MPETIYFFVTKGVNLLSDSAKPSRCMLTNEAQDVAKSMRIEGTLNQYDWYELENTPIDPAPCLKSS
jgi:hypothetical protein